MINFIECLSFRVLYIPAKQLNSCLREATRTLNFKGKKYSRSRLVERDVAGRNGAELRQERAPDLARPAPHRFPVRKAFLGNERCQKAILLVHASGQPQSWGTRRRSRRVSGSGRGSRGKVEPRVPYYWCWFWGVSYIKCWLLQLKTTCSGAWCVSLSLLEEIKKRKWYY